MSAKMMELLNRQRTELVEAVRAEVHTGTGAMRTLWPLLEDWLTATERMLDELRRAPEPPGQETQSEVNQDPVSSDLVGVPDLSGWP